MIYNLETPERTFHSSIINNHRSQSRPACPPPVGVILNRLASEGILEPVPFSNHSESITDSGVEPGVLRYWRAWEEPHTRTFVQYSEAT